MQPQDPTYDADEGALTAEQLDQIRRRFPQGDYRRIASTLLDQLVVPREDKGEHDHAKPTS